MEALSRLGRSRAAAAQRAARAGVHVTGAAQIVLRTVIEDGASRVSDLARRANMSDAVMSRQATVLEELGLVERAGSAEDGRVAMVSPTAEGRRVGKRLRAAADEIFEEHLARWSAGDLSRLADLMEALADDLSGTSRSSRVRRG